MAYEFHLPDIGEGLAEATVVSWLVPVGGRVGLDQPMVEVETDKAVVEIPAPRAGIVLHHGAPEGATVAVESLLVVIGEEGEEWAPGETLAAPPPARSAPAPQSSQAAPIVGSLEEAEAGTPARIGPPKALPLVRRLAAALGVDLGSVGGTGPGGRILRSDVEAAAGAASGPVERVKMSATRLAIARNLTKSWQEIPHVTTFGTADPTALLAARAAWKSAHGESLPVEALLIGAMVPLLEAHPEFNAVVDGDHVVYRRHYDVGFAVDTPDGLMVAVVRGADTLDVASIAGEVRRLAAAARDRTIAAADLRRATFTISNIGAVGGGFGTPIIPYGTTAILSVGRAEEKPVVRDGKVVVGRELPLSLSYDHRVIDGAKGRVFMAAAVEAIEGIE
ncbi:MAG: dihydrolipoamide acetyltransferase family protein [Acidimicrobiia bacterium]|nr:MAG: dihydrolipoamide acetyltransferase family protein [Acidimicrobiia bacterium]